MLSSNGFVTSLQTWRCVEGSTVNRLKLVELEIHLIVVKRIPPALESFVRSIRDTPEAASLTELLFNSPSASG